MKMDFEWDKVDGLAKALGGRIELLEKLMESKGLTPEMYQVIAESDFRKDFMPLYGFHIDSNESDPYMAVTYLEDAVGMQPAYMDYEAGEFNYGSWENAFFMPRPCMLKYDGTVDYYLDPNDYSKKEDGTDSDVDDFEYEGNAMMEWGRDGKQIWYKIVPDPDDNTSASVYFCEAKIDDGFHAWSFINNQGVLVDHFYTPIYNGTIDGDGKLRSISGKDNAQYCQNKKQTLELNAARLNNPGEDLLWYTETFADITFINLLLVLIGKCLDTQEVFGNGVCNNGTTIDSVIDTGTLNDKGLFFGSDDTTTGVKVFGMENWWGNVQRRFAGLMLIGNTIKYKLTYGTEDGSESNMDDLTGSGYIDSGISFEETINDFILKHLFTENGCMLFKSYGATGKSYYSDGVFVYINSTYKDLSAYRGARSGFRDGCGAFYLGLYYKPAGYMWWINACLSCKPLAPAN